MTTAEDAGGSQTLERGLAVLVTIGEGTKGLTATEAAEACGLHRSVIYRLLVSLERTGFATRDAEGRYRPGPALSALARNVPELRDIVQPELEAMASHAGATASLVEVRGNAAVTTLIAEPRVSGPLFTYRLGNRDPLDRGAGGIAALASGPPASSESGRVTETRTRGYIVTRGELTPGAIGVAAPLPGWPVRAAISLLSSRHDDEPLLVAAVASTAARIAAQTLPPSTSR